MLLGPPVSWQPMKVIGGRFTLLGRLAFGGMAEVWLARQSGPQGFNRMVVVKRVLEIRAHEPEVVQMFVDEARLGGLLTHPNIVQTVDFGEDEGVPFIVLEYLFGETLGALAKTCRQRVRELPIPLAVRIVSDATLGLSWAHELKGLDGRAMGIVHRDISPQNLLVTYDGVVKVLDFGIARSVDRASYTDSTQVRGRVTYMSPEQLSAQPLDQRADVFALGVVLWEAVTGTPLYSKAEQADALVVMKLLSTEGPLPSAREVNPAVPEELDRIIARALEKDRERRYATSAQLHAALEGWLRRQPEPPNALALAGLMVDLFADRQQERTRVIQRLSTGTATPKWTTSMVDVLGTKAPATATATNVAKMPADALDTSRHAVPGPARRQSRSAMAAVVLLALSAAAVGYAMIHATDASPSAPAAGVVQERRADEEQKQPEALPPAPPARPPQPAPAVAAVEAVAPPEEKPEPKPAVAAEPKPKSAKGRLRLDSDPWTTVFLNGKKLGDTPLVDIKVPSGQLELLLVNEEQKIRTVINVDVMPGETTVKRLQF
ncbi:MAG: serine/threonine protein kinase [Archangiaceae bacterium]|nr:serine/threonine protein kinase [Archangiaceae bacterium]